jgi:uncharacterized delta-60 repeat protein
MSLRLRIAVPSPHSRRPALRGALVLRSFLVLAAALVGGDASAAPGDVDPTFGVSITGGSPTIVRAIAVQPDGKFVIGGDFLSVGGQPRPGIARLNADGSVDPTFAPSFYFANINAIHLAANGNILVGGTIYLTNTVSSLRQVVWLAADGAQVGDINLSSTLYDDDSNVVFSVLVEPSGDIVIGGSFYFLQNQFTPGLARISGGVVASPLGATAQLANDISGQLVVTSLAREADGQLVVAGQFGTGGRRGLVRIDPDGTPDASFVSTGTAHAERINAVAIEPDGQILLSGAFTTINGDLAPRLARLHADGVLNQEHAPVVLYDMGAPQTMLLQGTGQILLGGILGPINNTTRYGVARFNPDFSLDSFYPNPNGVNGTVSSLAVDGSGNVLIGGFFTTVGGISKPTMARLLDTPNSVPQLSNVSVTASVDENGTVTLTGGVSDADAGQTLSLSVNWGDGSAATVANYAGGATFSLNHQYLDDNPSSTSADAYTITLALSDGSGGSDTDSTSTTVNNLAPALSGVALSASSITAGGSVTLSGSVSDAGTLDSHSISIAWGDGATTTLSLAAGATSFSADHAYANAGSFTVNVGATDDDGGAAAGASASLAVTPPATPPAAPSNLNAVVTATRSGKNRIYTGSLTWTDNSTDETGFIVQRFVKAKRVGCVVDTAFTTVVLGANATGYTDATATGSTCGYQVAARNANGDSAFVRDLDVTGGIRP